eukprot:jgi/Mesen1/6852/ME000351S05970
MVPAVPVSKKGAAAKSKAGGKASAATAPLQPSAALNSDGSVAAGRTIEQTYLKKTPLEHVLLRPDTYVGSIEKHKQLLWVYEGGKMVQREITYVPGLHKIFDEILVNAADNKQRDPTMDCLKVDIDPEANTIRVWNNGKGVPVEIHAGEKCYVAEMIFGNLLTSSNYDDTERKTTGGRNGYGAKLANIFSTEFVIETADGDRQRRYRQVFNDNMSRKSKPVIAKCKASENWTCVTFRPDLSKFCLARLEDDIVALMSKRVVDIAGCLGKTVKVVLGGARLPVKSFSDYVGLYLDGSRTESDEPLPRIYEKVSDQWEVCMSLSEGQFQQVSFVNSIATIRGGTHVALVTEQVVSALLEKARKKAGKAQAASIKPFQIRNHLWVFVNALVVNPAFDSQTKETLNTRASEFGSTCKLSDKFIDKVGKSGVIESVLSWAMTKQSKELKKTDGSGKRQRLTGIDKLDDANDAGGKHAADCTLILTEGDSAKTLAIMENKEISHIKQIMGLQQGKEYDHAKSLRYGHLMIMTDQTLQNRQYVLCLAMMPGVGQAGPHDNDGPHFLQSLFLLIAQDHDGSHIKGLLVNFLHTFWPSLLKVPNFLLEFITPIVKATDARGKNTRSFYTLPEYEAWKDSLGGTAKGWTIKYYKGLGTSTPKEAKEYFAALEKHKKDFIWSGEQDGENIELAFSKKKIEARKAWLRGFEPGTFLDQSVSSINYTDFVNKELILFSLADNLRSIPSVMDGLKPGQRKILFCCFKRNLKSDIKLFGNALTPKKRGALVLWLSRCRYAPILPMVLVNGSEGIGTGWSSSVPNYNPRDIVANIKHLLHDEPVEPMQPWYRGFKGTIEYAASKEGGKSYTVTGVITKKSDTVLDIVELPLKKWTQDYKEFLESLLLPSDKVKEPFLKDVKEYHTDTAVHFEVHLTESNMEAAVAEGLHKKFKLTSSISMGNLHLFDPAGRINKYDSPEEIVEAFYSVRLEYYNKRKAAQLEQLRQDLTKLDNRVRFILAVVNGDLVVSNRKKADLLAELKAKDFASMDEIVTIKPKLAVASQTEADDSAEVVEPNGEEPKAGASVGRASSYEYLLGMSLWSLTLELVQSLCKERDAKKEVREALLETDPKSLWEADLDAFLAALEASEEKAKEERAKDNAVRRKANGGPRKSGAASGVKLKRKRQDDDDDDGLDDDFRVPKKTPKRAPPVKTPRPSKQTTLLGAFTPVTALAKPKPADRTPAATTPKPAATTPEPAAPKDDPMDLDSIETDSYGKDEDSEGGGKNVVKLGDDPMAQGCRSRDIDVYPAAVKTTEGLTFFDLSDEEVTEHKTKSKRATPASKAGQNGAGGRATKATPAAKGTAKESQAGQSHGKRTTTSPWDDVDADDSHQEEEMDAIDLDEDSDVDFAAASRKVGSAGKTPKSGGGAKSAKKQLSELEDVELRTKARHDVKVSKPESDQPETIVFARRRKSAPADVEPAKATGGSAVIHLGESISPDQSQGTPSTTQEEPASAEDASQKGNGDALNLRRTSRASAKKAVTYRESLSDDDEDEQQLSDEDVSDGSEMSA